MSQTQTFKYKNRLQDKLVFIFGGTTGIGYAVAEGCLEHGARVFISGSNTERLEKAISTLKSTYSSLHPVVHGSTCDLSDEANLEANLKRIFDEATSNGTHPITHFVTCAGDAFAAKPLSEVDLASTKAIFTVRYFAPYFALKVLTCTPGRTYLTPGPEASATLTGGVAAEKPWPGSAMVTGASAAVHGLARGLAYDLKPLRVNAIAPGAVLTDFFVRATGDKEGKMGERSLVGKIGRPEDTAQAYLYVMQDWQIDGRTISTDGGMPLF